MIWKVRRGYLHDCKGHFSAILHSSTIWIEGKKFKLCSDLFSFQAKIFIKLYTKMLENNHRSLCYSTNSSRSKQTTRMLFWYRWQKIRPPRIHDFFSPVNFVFDSGIAMSLWKMDRKLASIPLEKFCVIVASRHRKVGLDFWLKIGALCLGQWVTIVSQKASILIFMHFNL